MHHDDEPPHSNKEPHSPQDVSSSSPSPNQKSAKKKPIGSTRSTSSKRSTNTSSSSTVAKPRSKSHPRSSTLQQYYQPKLDTSVYTMNDTWSSEFILAARDYISHVNRHDAEPRWSRIDDAIPFKVFDLPHEQFIVRHQNLMRPDVIARSASGISVSTTDRDKRHRSASVNSSTINRRPPTKELPSMNDSSISVDEKTFLTAVPGNSNEDFEYSPRNTRNDEAARKVESKLFDRVTPSLALPPLDLTHNQPTLTYGGMNISAPEQLLTQAEEASSHQYLPSFCKRSKTPSWELVREKPVYIVPNPLQKHPFLFRKEKVSPKSVLQPEYTRGLDKEMKPPELPQHQSKVSPDLFVINNEFRPPKRLVSASHQPRSNRRFVSPSSPDLYYLEASSATLCSRSSSVNNMHTNDFQVRNVT